MALATGERTFKPGERLHAPLTNFLTILSGVAYGFNWIAKQTYSPNGKGSHLVQSEVCNLSFFLPGTGPLEQAMNDEPSPAFGFVIAKLVEMPKQAVYLGQQTALMVNMITPIFCLHFETCSDWLKANRHTNTTQWPMTLDFARFIRNAASHGGRLEISSQNYRTVRWHGLAYKPADNRKLVIGHEVFMGDMLALMIEVDDELVALGAAR